METLLLIAQLVLGLLLILFIMIQEKGDGLGEALGGQSQTSFQSTKRGAEQAVAKLTIVTIILFLAVSVTLNFVG